MKNYPPAAHTRGFPRLKKKGQDKKTGKRRFFFSAPFLCGKTLLLSSPLVAYQSGKEKLGRASRGEKECPRAVNCFLSFIKHLFIYSTVAASMSKGPKKRTTFCINLDLISDGVHFKNAII